VLGVGAFKDGVGFASYCVGITPCAYSVSVLVSSVVFKVVAMCWDGSVALCANPEKTHCVEC